MKYQNDINGVAARVTAIRRELNLTRPEMAEALKMSSNAYSKYERAFNYPSLRCRAILSNKFDISMDWLLLNKGFMHFSEIEKVLQENQVLKQEKEKWTEIQKQEKLEKPKGELYKESVLSPEALIVTEPDIKELLRAMQYNPLFKHRLLTYFYRYKQGETDNQEPQE